MKKPDPNDKVTKYYVNRKKGMTKKLAAARAGYLSSPVSIESSKKYQHLVEYYRDDLLQEISMKQIAKEHVKIISQDEDRGSKLQAIKFAVERIEPEAKDSSNDDSVTVVLRGKLNL